MVQLLKKTIFQFHQVKTYLPKRKNIYAHKTFNTNVHNILIVYLILKLERLRDPERSKESFVVLKVFCILSVAVFYEHTHLSKVNKLNTLSSCSFCMKVIPWSSLNNTRPGIKTSKYESLFCLFKLFARLYFGFRIKRIISKTLWLVWNKLDSIY